MNVMNNPEKTAELIETMKSVFISQMSVEDECLRGFTFEELITTLQSNEANITEETVMRVANEILQASIQDMIFSVKYHMNEIIEQSIN
jgi:hypothetical protein